MTNHISKPQREIPPKNNSMSYLDIDQIGSGQFVLSKFHRCKKELEKTKEALLTAQIQLLVRERDIKTISQSFKKNIEINKKLFEHLKHINLYVKDEVTNALLLDNAPELKLHNHMESIKQNQTQKEEDSVCEIDDVTAEYYRKMCDWSPPNTPQREMNRYGNNDNEYPVYQLF